MATRTHPSTHLPAFGLYGEAGTPAAELLHIPVAMGLLGPGGESLPLRLAEPPEVGWFCLLGGLASGELSRRLFNLPRTTGYVLCGLVLGQSGLGWIDPYVLGSAQFFIYPALGLILFELGQRVPFDGGRIDPQLITLGLIESAAVFVLVLIVMFLPRGLSGIGRSVVEAWRGRHD